MDIFNIRIEFDHDVFRRTIEDCAKRNSKGYVCVVDANVLTMAHNNLSYREVVKNSYVNTCDGSSLATMANLIYGTTYRALSGPDIFAEYVERGDIKQLLLGNTKEKFNQIKEKLASEGKDANHLVYMSLPFATIDEFDYEGISKAINEIKPSFIWVSLGAPKQENFMVRLLPYLNQGLLFGIGAAFNFYVGDIAQPKFHLGSFRFIWLYRIFREPKKQFKRLNQVLLTIPFIFREEKKKAKAKKLYNEASFNNRS